jgi:hypothetical protein
MMAYEAETQWINSGIDSCYVWMYDDPYYP